MGEQPLLASDVQHLFHVRDYTRLKALVDEGKAIHRFLYRADNPNWWGTILGFSAIEKDVVMFRYIVETCDVSVLCGTVVDSSVGTCFWIMNQIMGHDPRSETKRTLEVMVEIALEHHGMNVFPQVRGMPRLRYLGYIYYNSLGARTVAVTAAVWCCQAIRASGADGLGELLGERMQAESAWEYEPKIKRTKY
jgi:hypothetical protein